MRVSRRKRLVVGHHRIHSQLGPQIASGVILFGWGERGVIGFDVEELRQSPRFGLSHSRRLGGN